MLSRASRIGVRSISDIASAGASFGSTAGAFVVLAGGYYMIDSKIETKTNHLEIKLDSLTQAVNTLAVGVARIEEHIRK